MSRYSRGAKTRIKPSNSGSSGIRDTHGRQTVVHPVRYDLIPGHAEINRSMYYARVWLNSDRDHGDMDGFGVSFFQVVISSNRQGTDHRPRFYWWIY